MKVRNSFLSLVLCTSIAVHALNPIVIKGHKFFDTVTKSQFFVKGVAYQPRSGDSADKDPLIDASACARDASLMAKIGMNVVRVYEVDPKVNHDACMKSFADNGIYLLLDIPTPTFSINRSNPQYDVAQYTAYMATIDAFSQYDNMLAFIAGNEVTNDKTNTEASPFVKAIIRDAKRYIKTTQRRKIPVGYASNDDSYIRDAIKDYFVCGEEDSQADFFGMNLYEWCGDSTFEKSGFADRTKEFENYSKPVFLSEYGCNLVTPRVFGEVSALYGPSMTQVWSGGVVYEWTQESNNYGLVKIDGSTGKVELLQDYTNLQNALAKVNPQGVSMDSVNEQRPTLACPPITDNWKASAELPPTPSEGTCECMQSNLACTTSQTLSDMAMISTSSTNSSIIGTQIDTLCGQVSCKDIESNGGTGSYGAYSFCSPVQKLGYLYNSYVQGNKASQCEFEGFAQQVQPKRNDIMKCSMIAPKMTSIHSSAGGPQKSNASLNHSKPWVSLATLSIGLILTRLLF
ncbi:Glucanosyltransferase-domain-containing protein [Spinellus fusiger]|nr:Glucanosyltransferase-domain-containing protein [Spinellus fusiger]